MAKAKKKAKAKAKKSSPKKVKKAAVKKAKKVTAKKKVIKKKAVAKKVVAKKKMKKDITSKKKVEKVKVSSKKEEKVVKQVVHPVKPEVQAKTAVTAKPVKEKKKTKEELAEEREAMGYDDAGYSWENNLADMKSYEPTTVFRKPEPPQPKFKGKKDNRSRYSDKELGEFRAIINEKIKEAVRDYELLKNTLAHRDEQGTDDTSPTFKVLEDGSDAMSREEIAQLASRQEKHIQNLKNALIRIENKTYGICRVTGKLIPKERLKSVPHATLSIEAKLSQNY